ncbi:hypothetical protein [Vibrio splendidus]|uniref:hypothetical protein n=1 Tax=Vibrio splendidus TaxID=29497 RepID=UPI0003019F4C|nr:hypothetical protein [Vibrio splendidus]OEE52713.1 hypothetical protein A146_25220 [Vibrio splendidus FF-500]
MAELKDNVTEIVLLGKTTNSEDVAKFESIEKSSGTGAAVQSSSESLMVHGNNELASYSPYLGIGSLVLVIVGWRVIYHNAKKLATRTESKSFIEDTTKILSDIESLSVDYWLAGRKTRIETEQFVLLVNAKLITLNSRLEILAGRAINVEVVDLSNILQYSTLECEDVDRKSDLYRRERVQVLLDEINSAHANLYKQYQNVYKPTFSFKSAWGHRP